MRTVPLKEIVTWLDEYLDVADVPDAPNALNGLQVGNRGEISALVAAVDASQQTIDRLVEECGPGTMLLVHHGLFWDGNRPITGRRLRRLRALIGHDIAVYSAHIPLDIHPVVGNNVVLAAMLGILDPVPFDEYHGVPIGAAGHLIMSREQLVDQLEEELTTRVHLIAGGPEITTRVGIITGAAGGAIERAAGAGLDTFITGEGSHHTTFDAQEFRINVIYAGHYATETLGVKALAEELSEHFGIPWNFHDHPTGL